METKRCNSEILISHHQLGQKNNIITHIINSSKKKKNKQTFIINQIGNNTNRANSSCHTWNPRLSGILIVINLVFFNSS